MLEPNHRPAQKAVASAIQDLPLAAISASVTGNDRTVFDAIALQELADSIRENGLAQPITVRPLAHERYEIVAGERRFRAHQLLGVATIRAIVQPMSDAQAAAVMLAENTGRKDLDPVDEARAYQTRIDHYGWDKKTVAEKAGVSIQIVNNRLKLLSLRDDLLHLVRSGQLQIGYAQIIAESELDKNRQLIALKRLNECLAPTPAWLRKECSELASQQAQGDMFESPLFGGTTYSFEAVQTKQVFVQNLPADPRKDKAPVSGATYRKMVENQIAFWLDASDKWDRFGKSAPRDRCISAAKALQDILVLMPAHSGKGRKVTNGSKSYAVYELAAV